MRSLALAAETASGDNCLEMDDNRCCGEDMAANDMWNSLLGWDKGIARLEKKRNTKEIEESYVALFYQ